MCLGYYMTRRMKFHSIALGFALIFLAGCASVESTADFYIPSTTAVFPPKPKDYPIPILDAKPSRPTRVIGRLAFTSELGFPFMRKSMEYNARRVGADIVVLKHADSQTQILPYYVPPTTNWMPVSTYSHSSYRGKHGKKRHATSESVTYIPVYQPGYWTQNTRIFTTIDSEMLVYRK